MLLAADLFNERIDMAYSRPVIGVSRESGTVAAYTK